jgi:DNA-binding NtrC family response regulator
MPLATLDHTNQDLSRAAGLLRIDPSAVYRKLPSYSGCHRSRRSSHSR